MNSLTKQVVIMTKMLVQVCDKIQDEKDRNATMDGVKKVKDVDKEKDKKVEGSLVAEMEHTNGMEGQRNKIRENATNQEEESKVDMTNIGQENDKLTSNFEILWQSEMKKRR